MKTLFLFSVHISTFYVCTCFITFALSRQPSKSDSVSNVSYVDSMYKKCNEVNGEIRKGNYMDQDLVLCFGLKVFSQPFPNMSVVHSLLDGVEKESNTELCIHFQEMKLNSSNLDESAEVYNLQFQDKDTCERACLDITGKVNPVCSSILVLSHHSKGNLNRSATQAPPNTLPGGKADKDNNEISNVKINSGPPRISMDQDHKRIPSVQQQPAARLTLVSKSGEDKSNVLKTKIIDQEQTSQILKPALPDEGKLHGQKQQTDVTGIDLDKEKKEAISEGEAQVTESAMPTATATSRIQEKENHSTPDVHTANYTLKKTAGLKKEAAGTTTENRNVITKTENQGKSDSFVGQNIPVHSSGEIPESSESNKNETAATTKPKSQETISTGKDVSPPKKGNQKEENVSQNTNVKLDKEFDNDLKPQTEDKETENSLLTAVGLKVTSKTTTEETPKSNIDDQKTNQDNGKAGTNENAETESQSGRDDPQKMVSDKMQFTDNTGTSMADLDTSISVETGESNDNTEYTSGGGTSVYYARPGSGGIETDNTDINTGRIVFQDKSIDDDTHFFAYFMTTMVFCIVGYLVFHNKQKILALALEGRARRGRRRPNTSGYRKLDSNLEEAISSSKSASVTQVIY